MNGVEYSGIGATPSDPIVDSLWLELRQLIDDLGKDGGIISPSVYDTAQVLRFHPPEEGVAPALAWLLSQQQADGGWGDPAVPLARDMPTMAAVLALHELGATRLAIEAVDAGLQFLSTRTDEWIRVHIDLIPIAAELIIPWLLQETIRQGLQIDLSPYAHLFTLREKKKAKLSLVTIEAGYGPTYSWEALDMQPDLALLDTHGSIGHSPSATARWLQLAQRSTQEFGDGMERAKRYLRRAERATRTAIPGIVPTVWPLPVFEYTYCLHACYQNNASGSALEGLFKPYQKILGNLLHLNSGLGFSETFAPDVDSTSVGALVVMQGGGTIDSEKILQFRDDGHFYTFPGELNPSVFSNAHALSALTYNSWRNHDTESFLLDRQLANGAWMPDKWHSSWIYTTLEMIDLLVKIGNVDELLRAQCAILDSQHVAGNWGERDVSNILDTSYAVIALQILRQHGLLEDESTAALQRGYLWLLDNYRLDALKQERLWLGKELYSPYRVDQTYVLSTILHKKLVL